MQEGNKPGTEDKNPDPGFFIFPRHVVPDVSCRKYHGSNYDKDSLKAVSLNYYSC